MSTLIWKETRFLKVPLTPDEVRARGEQLANFVKERDELVREHTKVKKRMADDAKGADGRIYHTAQIVNERMEERSVTVEMRCHLGLGLVEEVRTDTGEILVSRAATPDDKLRAQAEAQMPLPEPEKPKE
jgi:hypothetical protein